MENHEQLDGAESAAGDVREIVLAQDETRERGSILMAFLSLVPFAGIYVKVGVWWASLLLLGVVVFFTILSRMARRRPFKRLRLDRTHVEILPPKGNRSSRDAVSFDWDEVVDVSWKLKWFEHRTTFLRVTLSRPLDPNVLPAQDTVLRLSPAVWRNAEFMEAMRLHVGPRLVPNSLEPPAKADDTATPLWVRLVFGLGLLAFAAAAVAGAAVLRSGGVIWLPQMWLPLGAAIVIAFTLGPLSTVARTWEEEVWFGLALAGPMTFVIGGTAAVLWMLFIGGYLGVVLAVAVGILATGMGLMMLLHRQRLRGRHVVLSLALVFAGVVGGIVFADGLPAKRVCVGWLGSCTPWTPQGDAFVALVPRGSIDPEKSMMANGPVDVIWFTANGGPESTASFDDFQSGPLVGQDAALVAARRGKPSGVWYVPRREGEARLLLAKGGLFGAQLSPSGDWAVLRTEEQMGNEFAPEGRGVTETTWHRVDMRTGALRTLGFPKPAEDVRWIVLRDDGAIRWYVGRLPTNEDGQPMTWEYVVPPDGHFANPGTPFKVWAWNPESDAEPALLYSAAGPWLGVYPDPGLDALRVCRLDTNASGCKAYEKINLAGPTPVVTPSTVFEFGQRPTFMAAVASPDGRLQCSVDELINPRAWSILTDRRTGAQKHLRQRFSGAASFSPGGDRLLFEATELNWSTGFATRKSSTRKVVRLIDLKKEWPEVCEPGVQASGCE